VKALGALLLLVALVGAGGWWNYQRNAHLDQDLGFRPYETLSNAQLDQLLEAHRQQVVALQARAGQAPSLSVAGVADSDLEGKIDAFDRFQNANRDWKQRHRAALEEQTRVEALEHEQGIRKAGLDSESGRILRRVTHF
jgi:hypothetical protein